MSVYARLCTWLSEGAEGGQKRKVDWGVTPLRVEVIEILFSYYIVLLTMKI